MTEHAMQVSIMTEAAYRANQDPRWGLLFAIPNGGKRSKATGGKLKAEGVKAGVPDLCLPVARPASPPYSAYHGLFLELKRPGESPRIEQTKWINDLIVQGYFATWVNSAEEAIRTLDWYINGAKP